MDRESKRTAIIVIVALAAMGAYEVTFAKLGK